MVPTRWSHAASLTLVLLALATSLRAQVTEVPQTMEPGHVLMRMDAISFGLEPDTSAPNQYKALALGTTLVSAGVTSTVDFEAGAQLFLRDTFDQEGGSHTDSGIGEVSLRVKWEFWTDPSTGEAAAIIPYILVPTNSSAVGTDYTQGGIIVPWSIQSSTGLKAGAMLEWDILRNEANTRYDTRWYGSAYTRFDLGKTFGVYGEATASLSTEGTTADIATVGAGATLDISGNFQWDFEESRVLGQGRNAWTEVLRFRWKIL